MEFDVNKVAATVATDMTKQAVKSIFSYIPSQIKSKYDKYFNNFEEYIERTHRSCCYVRTIINKDKPVDISSIYVKAKFRCGKEIIGDDELSQRIRDGQRVVVSGFGGIGKTIFCKYFWKTLYDNPMGKVPVFFELRAINDLTTQSLANYIRITLSTGEKPIPEDVFVEMMSGGRFVFIFDGFDEVAERFRLDIQAQILELSIRYKGCCFLVSSRADDRFGSWIVFHTYHALEFDKTQARSVVQKIDFDKEIRKEFLQEILEKRYDDYKNLFSTPLLTLMMLMTYLQIRYIPDGKHVFYRYAFQTLYTLHDASKQGFQRKRFVEMSESDFINVFSLFCLTSYVEMEHSFTKEQIRGYLERVKSRARVDYIVDEFIKECVESVNLLYKDGDQYSFLHRSFQEYFCAYAVTHYFPDKISELIDHLPVRRSDSVFSMMYSINQDVVSKMYIMPAYKKLQGDYNLVSKSKNYLEVLSILEVSITLMFSSQRKGRSLYAYSLGYGNPINQFVESIVCIFKSDVPEDLMKQFSGFSDLTSVTSSLRTMLRRMSLDKIDHHYRARFDFGAKSLTVFQGDSRTEVNDVVVDLRYENIDSRILENRYFTRFSQKIKAELIFSKKKCDEIVRKDKEVSKGGFDILSL